MTGKLDWETILAMYSLGGYDISAVLSNSTALLAITGLALIQPENIWLDYTDGDDIQTAIAKAIYELTNGGSVMGDYEKIGEEILLTDAVSLTCDIDSGEEWSSFDVLISGLRSDAAASVSDNLILWFNGDPTLTNYNCVNFYHYYAGHTTNQAIGTKYGFWLPYALAAANADSGCFGTLYMQIFSPLSETRKTHCQWHSGLGGESSGEPREGFGSGHYEQLDAIESIGINPENGSYLLVDPDDDDLPDELSIRVYGRR